ncbi:MAG: sialidase family protein [Acidimicrobiales bacterium]
MRRRTGAVVAVVVGLGVVLAVVVAWASRVGGVEVGADRLVNPPGFITVNNSPTIARQPDRPERLVVAHRIDRPGFSALLEWSDDGGATWQPTALPLPPETEPCAASPEKRPCPFAPDLAFGPDGTLYVLYVGLQGNGNTPADLWLATSNDAGRSLAQPVRVAGALTFQPRLVVDARGTIQATWLQADNVALNRLVGQARIVSSHSSDGGRTFSEPVALSDPERERVGAASPVIDSAGDLVVLYQDFKDDRRDFEGLDGPVPDGPFALVVTRSEDGGRTFSPGIELESGLVPARRFLVFLPEYPSLAAGPDGVLYAAWADARSGDEDVLFRRSDDGGATWAGAVTVNDNPAGDGTDQYLPRLSVAPGGRVDVLFYDRRRDPGNVATDAFLATSDDGGRSFTNHRVSSASFSSEVGPTFGPAYGYDFGTRLGLVSDDDSVYATWTDTRLGNGDTGRQDVFGVSVHGLGSSGLPLFGWLLAALALAAVVVAWFLSRRSRGSKGRLRS